MNQITAVIPTLSNKTGLNHLLQELDTAKIPHIVIDNSKKNLGFAVAVHVEPEILLVDEILSVGDAYFQKKSLAKIKEFKDKGVTMVIVSHAQDAVRQFCDKGLYISYGEQKFFGSVKEAIEKYQG